MCRQSLPLVKNNGMFVCGAIRAIQSAAAPKHIPDGTRMASAHSGLTLCMYMYELL